MLRIAGDINLTDGFFDTGFGVGSSIAAGADPFAKIPRGDDDVWIGNFEGVTADTSSKSGIYGKQFLIAPGKLAHVRHFDYYNVANNHVMQHGAEAFQQMLLHLRSFGCTCFGTVDRRSVEFTHQGRRFRITGFSQRKENFDPAPLYWYDPEYSELQAECTKGKQSDFQIAYIHWGNEFMDRPYNDQIRFAHSLIDMGYDLVVGMHPHLLQGYEQYRGKRIYYSIGNFVFNMHWEPLRYAALLKIEVSEDRIIVGHDYVYIEKDFFPRLVNEENVPAQYRFSHLNSLIGNSLSNEAYYSLLRVRTRRYRKDNRLTILRNLFKFRFSYAYVILCDFIKRRIDRHAA